MFLGHGRAKELIIARNYEVIYLLLVNLSKRCNILDELFALSFVCICLCMFIYVCTDTCTHLWTWMWKLEVDIRCVPHSVFTLLSDTRFLTECEAHQFGYLVGQKALWTSLSVSVQNWDYKCVPMFFTFYVHAGYLISGSCAWPAAFYQLTSLQTSPSTVHQWKKTKA